MFLLISKMTLDCTDDKGKFDELVEDKGVKILIDPKALMHVLGTEMDFVDDKLRYEMVFPFYILLVLPYYVFYSWLLLLQIAIITFFL